VVLGWFWVLANGLVLVLSNNQPNLTYTEPYWRLANFFSGAPDPNPRPPVGKSPSNCEKVGLAVSAVVGSNHFALGARNRLVLAPPEERRGFQALSAASRHREELLPTCHSDSSHLLFVPHVAAWQ
jgi:hypothetical protein